MVTLAPPNTMAPEDRTFVDLLLAEQRDLTAVERFAQWHETARAAAEPAYRRLLPVSAPRPGEQYAFEVDVDKCSGCKACVTACHSLNGLDETETWRSVGVLVSKPAPKLSPSALRAPLSALHQHVTTACHHCADPGCLNGCPVLAYDKDAVTGIVRHLDDQCIGCQYCVMKCPYEVPKYSARLGIVRKCDMCTNRLAVGEAPACVQACPNEAIRITLVDQKAVVAQYREAAQTITASNSFLPDSPNPALTVPTTRFVSARKTEEFVAADHAALRLDHAHPPLVIMLVLTQAAAGMFLISALTTMSGFGATTGALNAFAFVILSCGLTASVLHLGQPLKAWRAFLGWRRSWLSREIIAFNAFAGMALPLALLPLLKPWGHLATDLLPALSIATALAGLGAVLVSGMVYVDTGRPFWTARITFTNFLGATLVLGCSLSAFVFAVTRTSHALVQAATLAGFAARTLLFVWRRVELHLALHRPASPVHFNARIICGLLPHTVATRTLLFVAATLLGVLTITNAGLAAAGWAGLAALVTLISELMGRYVFFAAGAAKRMPGGFRA